MILTFPELSLSARPIDHFCLGKRHDEGHLPKVDVHLLQRPPFRFGEEQPDDNGIGERTHSEDDVEPPSNLCKDRGRHLTEHEVFRQVSLTSISNTEGTHWQSSLP